MGASVVGNGKKTAYSAIISAASPITAPPCHSGRRSRVTPALNTAQP